MTTQQKAYEAAEDIFIDLAELLEPPERMSVSEAAEKFVYLNNPGAYIGPYLNATAPYMAEPMDVLASREHSGCVFVGPAQSSKALHLNTPIATPGGWTTMGEIKEGDVIYGDDGKPVVVETVSPHMMGRQCYRITFDDRTSIVTDEDHLWEVRDDYSERQNTLVQTKDMVGNLRYRGNRFRFSVANALPLEREEKTLLIDPYTLGVWLGDGSSNSAWLTLNVADSGEIVDRIRLAGYEAVVVPAQENTVTVKLDPHESGEKFNIRYMMHAYDLITTRVAGGKHIPPVYLLGSIEQRRELLRGLMDTDGTCGQSGVCSFSTSISQLADEVSELLTSLGYKVRRRLNEPFYTYKGERLQGKDSHELSFVAYADDPPFHLRRQIAKLTPRAQGRPTYTGRRRIEAVEPVESVPVCCIGVANDSRLFLAGRQMVPTHNTQALILNWLAYSIRVDPMDMIIYSPTQAAARDFSMRRVDRLHRHSKEIGALLARDRDADNKFDKHYRNGMIANLSWPTITEFAGKPVGRIALTDYDRMPDDVEGDGNPYDLGSKRTTTFGSFAMTLAESSPSRPVENVRWIRSTPHEAPPCKGILSLYNRGDRRRWYWPCYSCGGYFQGNFSQLEWSKRPTPIESAETVRLVCPLCGYKHDPERRQGMNEWGLWLRDGQSIDTRGRVVGHPYRSKMASFWLEGTAAAFTTWTNLVVTFINATADHARTGSEEELKKFYNTDLGVPYIPKKAENERLPEVLKSLAEDLPTLEIDGGLDPVHREPMLEPLVPADVRFLLAAVDVQKNMFIVQVFGICPGQPFDVVVIDRFAIRKSQRTDEHGDIVWVKPGSYLEDWESILEQVMERTYALSDGSGRRMQIKLTGCDSGGREGVTTNAYNFQRSLKARGLAGRFQLVKGDPSPSRPRSQITFPDSNRRDKLSVARGDVPVMLLNSNTLKDSLATKLDCMVPGRGMFRLPKWLPDWFFSEMCAETRNDKGWINPAHTRNEAWDLSYYCLGLAVSALVRAEGIDWTAPPGWAAPWDQNDLISEGRKKRFETVASNTIDFAALGAQLG